jgi:hypothetical protein
LTTTENTSIAACPYVKAEYPLRLCGKPRFPFRVKLKGIQQAALLPQEQCRELGVFVFFSTQDGDAWVLETTERDAFQAAASGQPLPVQENRDVIEVDWSHAFVLRDRRLFVIDHKTGAKEELVNAPTMQISAALRRIRKQYPAELLRQVHVQPTA